MERRALEVNLSHVLREPSESRAVRHAVREIARFERRKPGYLRSFPAALEQGSSHRLHVSPGLTPLALSRRPISRVISASIGVSELLGPAMTQAGFIVEAADFLFVDGKDSGPDRIDVPLFGSQAQLPAQTFASADGSVLTAALIVRPGSRELLIAGTEIKNANSETERSMRDRIARALEDLIRDYVDQWTPERALWTGPAEQFTPEITCRQGAAGGG
jgi:hypothetical protein